MAAELEFLCPRHRVVSHCFLASCGLSAASSDSSLGHTAEDQREEGLGRRRVLGEPGPSSM
jgi:hypothetical protein